MLWTPCQSLKSLALTPLGFGAPARSTTEMTLDVLSKRLNQRKSFLLNFGMCLGFLSSFPIVESADLADTDKWIISELDKLVKDCKVGFDQYNFFIPAIAIREFTWNVFAAHYIEMAKARAYGIGFSDAERDGAIYTLHKVLSTLLKLLAPITPYITDFLWQTLYSDKSIHTEQQAKEESNEGPNPAHSGHQRVQL